MKSSLILIPLLCVIAVLGLSTGVQTRAMPPAAAVAAPAAEARAVPVKGVVVPSEPMVLPATYSGEPVPDVSRAERKHLLEVKVTFFDGEADHPERSKRLSEPTIVVLEGQQASFLSGGEQPPPEGLPLSPMLRFGTSLEVRPGPVQNGKVLIDFEAHHTDRRTIDKDRTDLETWSHRVITSLTLGEALTLSRAKSPADRGIWFSIVVNDHGLTDTETGPPVTDPCSTAE